MAWWSVLLDSYQWTENFFKGLFMSYWVLCPSIAKMAGLPADLNVRCGRCGDSVLPPPYQPPTAYNLAPCGYLPYLTFPTLPSPPVLALATEKGPPAFIPFSGFPSACGQSLCLVQPCLPMWRCPLPSHAQGSGPTTFILSLQSSGLFLISVSPCCSRRWDTKLHLPGWFF